MKPGLAGHAAGARGPEQGMDTLHVLVVEDSPTLRLLVGLALRAFRDCRVLEAVDGADALRTMACEKVDLIITDLHMPIMDGLGLIGAVREHPSLRGIPVVLLGAAGAEEACRRGMTLGADAWLRKPFDPDLLARTVRAVLERHQGGCPGSP